LRRLLFVLPVFVLALLAGVFLFGLDPARDPARVDSPLIDRPVPAFRLPSLMGGPDVTEADLAGKVTVLNVFASWCIPCRAEHPILLRIAKDGKAQVIGLNYKDAPEDARAWLAELGNPYAKIAADREGRVAIDFGVYGVPETFIIDGDGRIRYKHVGPIMPFQYEERIAPAIERLAR
jgi:cytochrome c biogenesis protein CcmG/thiol:disulfide interchange protein DsbE